MKAKKLTVKAVESVERDWVKEVGGPACASIVEMVSALQCDYGRLEELREERDDWTDEDGETDHTDEAAHNAAWALANPDEAKELADLEAAAGECESEDDARKRIEEDPLSIQVRSGWHGIGEESTDEEFEILLATGGPAVRIVGELDNGEVSRPRLEVQDWGKPWTEYFDVERDTLLAYCQVFCFEH